jgi:hypothetical protein
MSCSATSSAQLSPPSRLQNSRLGSVPAYTAPSVALTATLNTSGLGNGTSSNVSPPSSLRFTGRRKQFHADRIARRRRVHTRRSRPPAVLAIGRERARLRPVVIVELVPLDFEAAEGRRVALSAASRDFR